MTISTARTAKKTAVTEPVSAIANTSMQLLEKSSAAVRDMAHRVTSDGLKDQQPQQAPQQETWRFTVDHAKAQQVHLVREHANGSTVWQPMKAMGNGRYTLTLCLGPGDYRFNYFATYFDPFDDNQSTVVNGHGVGLTAQRLTASSPRISVSPVSPDVPTQDADTPAKAG